MKINGISYVLEIKWNGRLQKWQAKNLRTVHIATPSSAEFPCVSAVRYVTSTFGARFVTYEKQFIQNAFIYVLSPYRIAHACSKYTLFLAVKYKTRHAFRVAALSSYGLQDSHIKTIFVFLESVLRKKIYIYFR
jgi:protoheme ferro-lyase